LNALYLPNSLSYAALMLRLPIILLLLWPVQAMAMNWEGHDDWMLDYGMADIFTAAIPEARPPPPRDCPVTPEMAAKNPYEQIPLPRHRCKVPFPKPDQPTLTGP
jgi:hypothetical protein